MGLIDDETIKKRFKTSGEYIKFLTAVTSVRIDFQEKYEFLGYKNASWEKFFYGWSLEAIKSTNPVSQLRKIAEISISKYLKRCIDRGDVSIMNNLLILIYEKRHYKINGVLEDFFNDISLYKIAMTEEYFEALKQASPILRQCLKTFDLGKFSLEEIKKLIDDSFPLYKKLNIPGFDARKRLDFIDRVLNLYPLDRINEIKSGRDVAEIEKIKYIGFNYNYFKSIYELSLEVASWTLDGFYKSLLLNYDLSGLKDLVNDYIKFKQGNYNFKGDKSFIWKLLRRCGKESKIKNRVETNRSIKPKTESSDEIGRIKDSFRDLLLAIEENEKIKRDLFLKLSLSERKMIMLFLDNCLDMTGENKEKLIGCLEYLENRYFIQFSRQKRTARITRFYNSFMEPKSLEESAREDIVKFMIDSLDKKSEDNVNRYLLEKKTYDEEVVSTAIEKIRKRYRDNFSQSQQSEGELLDIYRTITNGDVLEGANVGKIIDLIISTLPFTSKILVKKYPLRLLDKNETKRATEIIRDIKSAVKVWDINGIVLSIKRLIVGLFSDVQIVSCDQKEDAVIAIFDRLSLEDKKLLTGFFAGFYKVGDKRELDVMDILEMMKKEIVNYNGKTNLDRELLYEFFPDYPGVTPKRKVEVIDACFDKRSEASREEILDYLKDSSNAVEPSKRSKRNIQLLKKAVEKELAIFATVKDEPKKVDNQPAIAKESEEKLEAKKNKNIYDKLPDYPGVSFEEKKQVVDNLLESMASRERLIQYAAGLITAKSPIYKSTSVMFYNFKRKYMNYMENKEQPDKRIAHKIIYDHFPNYPGISFEEKKSIVDGMLLSLPKEKLDNLENYLQNKLTPSSIETRKAQKTINYLRKKYIDKYDKKGNKEMVLKEVFSHYPKIEGITYEGFYERFVISLPTILAGNLKGYVEKSIDHRSFEAHVAKKTVVLLKKRYNLTVFKMLLENGKIGAFSNISSYIGELIVSIFYNLEESEQFLLNRIIMDHASNDEERELYNRFLEECKISLKEDAKLPQAQAVEREQLLVLSISLLKQKWKSSGISVSYVEYEKQAFMDIARRNSEIDRLEAMTVFVEESNEYIRRMTSNKGRSIVPI